MMKAIHVEVSVSTPLDKLWQAWTESERITSWFAPEAHIEARRDGPFELFFDPSDHNHQCTKGCVITILEPERRLGFSWKGPDHLAELMNNRVLTSVLVTFHDEDGSTRVVLEHSGWGEGKEWEQAREWHQREWEAALRELKTVMESSD
jgi:uncharacterized protein YndB with AHSA1/START domain